MSDPRRALPGISAVLAQLADERTCWGRGVVKHAADAVLAEARARLADGGAPPDPAALVAAIRARARRLGDPAARAAINASGILLHTGLGRAPMPARARAAVAAACGATALQASLDRGDRSLREERAEELLRAITGCAAATIVNNCAGATMLALAATAAGREVIVSRGQLIEIGGAFRLPEVMELAGCRLREVGTTNRTHLRDYERAIGPETGAIAHIHTSNYRVRGFAGTPETAELAPLCRARGLPLIDDLGSGALAALAPFGVPDEPQVRHSLRDGADLVLFSGDKLLGGPQCGIILGAHERIAAIRRHPMSRMLRPCKLTLAALEATLTCWLDDGWKQEIPFWRLLARPLAVLRAQAETVAAAARAAGGDAAVVDTSAYVGSGSAPDEAIPSAAARVRHPALASEDLARRLRHGVPAVFGRLESGALLLDQRTVPPEDAAACAAAVEAACRA